MKSTPRYGFALAFFPSPCQGEGTRQRSATSWCALSIGYDDIWLTEHHFDQDGWSPALLPLAAGIATRTQRIRIGTFLLILPLHNALRVAEDAATSGATTLWS